MGGYEVYVPENWRLRNQREKLGLSQEEVAKKAGILLKQYQRFESSEHYASFSNTSLRIATAVLTALELDASAFRAGVRMPLSLCPTTTLLITSQLGMRRSDFD